MKFKIAAFISLVIPVVLLVIILIEKHQLERSLVLRSGTLIASKRISTGARSDVIYRHRLKSFRPYLEGTFSGIVSFLVSDKTKQIYQDPPEGTISKDLYWLNPRLKSEAEREAHFYTLKNAAIDHPGAIPYISLRLVSEGESKLSYQAEVLRYVLQEQIGLWVLFAVMIINILFFSAALVKFQDNKVYVRLFFIVFIFHLILVLY
jgi:hypothetical protein